MATAKKKTTAAKKELDEAATPTFTDAEIDDFVESEEKVANPNIIKKKNIYDHVSVATGLRKRDVREAVDSMLEYMHMCLSDGKDMQMPPLGKIKSIQRGTDDNIKMHHKVVLKKIEETEKKDD